MDFRKILKVIGLFYLAAPIILVTGCSNSEEETTVLADEEIVKEINEAFYELTISVKQDLSFLKAEVNFNFIKHGLKSGVANSFNDELFSLVTFLNNENKELEDSDLQPNKQLSVKIKYNYGNFKNELTKLKLIILPVN